MGKKNKRRNPATTEEENYSLWDKYKRIKKVHIVSNGIFTICKATTIDGVEEYYNWGKQSDREFVRRTTLPDAEIIVDPGVEKGWDYNG